MKMKVFKNGDVLITKDEYTALTLGNHTKDLADYVRRFVNFYYELKHIQHKICSTVSIEQSTPVYEEVYRMSSTRFKLFQEWSKLINEFEPDRPCS